MPMDPRLTALTTAAREGLAKRKGGKGRQTVQGFRRPVPLASAAVTTPSRPPNAPGSPLNTNPLITPSRQPNAPPPPGQTPGLTGDVREAMYPGAPAGSSPALGMLTDQFYKGTALKRKRTRTQKSEI